MNFLLESLIKFQDSSQTLREPTFNIMNSSSIFKRFLSKKGIIVNQLEDLKKLYRVKDNHYIIKNGVYKWTYYRMSSHMPDMDAWSIFRSAFAFWSLISNNVFQYVENGPADINLGFTSKYHTTSKGEPCVEYENGVLAHAWFPNTPYAGEIHFNDMVQYSSKKGFNSFSLLHVAIHEIGHSLGLRHNDDSNSIMYPYAKQNQHIRLNFNVFSSVDLKNFV